MTKQQTKYKSALYCRLSKDDDLNSESLSISTQKQILTEYAREHDYFIYDIFVDDGTSSTNTKKREEFNRMIAECMDGNTDMVITKSISRFARNTLDCLQYIRQLRELKIAMKRLFLKNYSCKFRRKFIEEAISTQEQARTNEFIAASTL